MSISDEQIPATAANQVQDQQESGPQGEKSVYQSTTRAIEHMMSDFAEQVQDHISSAGKDIADGYLSLNKAVRFLLQQAALHNPDVVKVANAHIATLAQAHDDVTSTQPDQNETADPPKNRNPLAQPTATAISSRFTSRTR